MNCVYILFTFQQLIFVNLKDDKNKRNTALFCNMKAKTRCVYCKIKNIINKGDLIIFHSMFLPDNVLKKLFLSFL